MNRNELIERVRELGGFEQAAAAEQAVRATLRALGIVLLPDERRAVSEGMSGELRQLLETPEHAPELDPAGFYALVERHEHVPSGRAREHAQVVCQALAEAESAEVALLLRRHLPRLASLFEIRDPPSPPERPEAIRRTGLPERAEGTTSTLAGGRPGSRHPLSDARPERAHAHSIARSDAPHDDTKLSSSHGFTQEREGETLASGKPGPKRPLSG